MTNVDQILPLKCHFLLIGNTHTHPHPHPHTHPHTRTPPHTHPLPHTHTPHPPPPHTHTRTHAEAIRDHLIHGLVGLFGPVTRCRYNIIKWRHRCISVWDKWNTWNYIASFLNIQIWFRIRLKRKLCNNVILNDSKYG